MPMGTRAGGPVRIPEGQLRPDGVEGAPMTVSHAMVGLMVPLQWFDEAGNGHNDVFMVVGDQVYKPPESERWAAELGSVKKELAVAVRKSAKAHFRAMIVDILRQEGLLGGVPDNGVDLPKDDDVDVLDAAADEVADEVAAAR